MAVELDSLVYNGKVLLALLITALRVINDTLENITVDALSVLWCSVLTVEMIARG